MHEVGNLDDHLPTAANEKKDVHYGRRNRATEMIPNKEEEEEDEDATDSDPDATPDRGTPLEKKDREEETTNQFITRHLRIVARHNLFLDMLREPTEKEIDTLAAQYERQLEDPYAPANAPIRPTVSRAVRKAHDPPDLLQFENKWQPDPSGWFVKRRNPRE